MVVSKAKNAVATGISIISFTDKMAEAAAPLLELPELPELPLPVGLEGDPDEVGELPPAVEFAVLFPVVNTRR